MTESPSIPRKKSTDSPYSFESLRKEGLKLVQELSGDIWTDYNVHDPGVTILEQLCYTLTDLIYRTHFAMEDYLTGEDGRIDFPYQALHPPEQIFPCRPTTAIDYRKTILDAVPEIENVWINPITTSHEGLYHITVRQRHDDGGRRRSEDIVTAITNVYRSNRNLCEDLYDITMLDEVDCELEANLTIGGSRDPDDIVAEIYYRCAKHMTGDAPFIPFDDMLREGNTFEEMFTGPSTIHGLMKDTGLDAESEQDPNALTSDLFSIIMTIEGVERIDQCVLRLRQEHGQLQANARPHTLRLAIPEQQHTMRVRLNKNRRAIPTPITSVRAKYDKLDFAYQSLRHTLQDRSAGEQPPQGAFRNLQEYYSLQNQFPFMYGINAYGVPASAPAEVKAKANQLKTYLLLFEQIMANYTANLHHARILFSGDPNVKQSYFFQPLDNTAVPNIEQVYAQLPPSRLLDKIVRGSYDAYKYPERKNRVLDYLLALYGEKFSQASLRHFNYCDTPNDVEKTILHNKMIFLRHIVDLGQNRAAGLDYGKPAWNTTNTSGLKKRISILLGLKYQHERSLTNVFTEEGLELISDEHFDDVRKGTIGLDFIDLDDIDARTNERFHHVPPTPSTQTETHTLLKEIIFLKQNLLSESILRNGITRDRYRIGSAGEGEDFQIVLRPQDDARWYYLASYQNRHDAVVAANVFRTFIISLNVESEGLHIVEHLLLRPSTQTAHDIAIPEHFYAFRMSVIFPSWTTRFHNPEFRKLAEETLRLNCPAHIYPEFYWFDFQRMREFETLYLKWIQHKSTTPSGSPELDTAATRVIEFLLTHQQPLDHNAQKAHDA